MTKPTQEEAEEAIRTLLKYIGEDAGREGLLKTPARVITSYDELFKGYSQNPKEILSTKFHDFGKFKEIVLLKNIDFTSYCEHHLLPIIGRADVAYIPDKAIIGLSKLARLVEVFARRLQVQERMTMQIAESLQEHLAPLGAAVRIIASHSCMSMRGILKHDAMMQTTHYTGVFTQDIKYKTDFLNQINQSN